MSDAQDKADDCVPLHKDCFLCDFDAGSDVLSNIKLFPAAVMEFLEQLKICKSCGPERVTFRLLKECANPILSLMAVVVFKKCGRWLIWFQFSSLGDKEMVENYIYIYFCREVRIGKNCALGLEYGPRPAEGTVFPNTDRPRLANNVFIFFFRRVHVLCKQFLC